MSCGGSDECRLVEERGAAVELAAASAGMPAGSAGIVIGRYAHTNEVLVRFRDGGPVRVPRDVLRVVTRRP